MRLLRLAVFAVLLSLTSAHAVEPQEIMADPKLEARARVLSQELRCLVCQNQSIDDSDADLAHDLRVLVRERLVAGDTDAEATQYIVDRYGEFVLLNPVVAPHTIALWIAAPVVLLIGIVAVFVGARRRRAAPVAAAPLTEEEQAALEELDPPKG